MKIQQFRAQRMFMPLGGISFVIAAGGTTRCVVRGPGDYPNSMVVNTGGSYLDVAFCASSAIPNIQPPSVSIPPESAAMFLPTEGLSAAMSGDINESDLPVMLARSQSGSGSCLFFFGTQQVFFPVEGAEDGVSAFTTNGGINAFALGTAQSPYGVTPGTYL